MTYFLELDPYERQRADTAARPGELTTDIPDPGVFAGTGAATGRGLMSGTVKQGATVESAFSGAWIGFQEGAAAALLPEPKGGGTPDVSSSTRSQREQLMQSTGETLQALRPDPMTTGFVGNLLHGFSDMGARALLAAPGGKLAMFGNVATTEGYGSMAVSGEKGIDDTTAAAKAGVDAITAGVGVVIPGAGFAKSIPGDIALTVGANAGLGIAQRAANQQILQAGGYDKQAKEEPGALDPVSVATDAALGGLFWGLARHSMNPALPRSETDAARAQLNAQHHAEGSAPGTPADPQSAATHANNMDEALRAVAEGRQPTLSADASFEGKPTPAPAPGNRPAITPDLSLETLPVGLASKLSYDAPELDAYAAAIEQRYGLPTGLLVAIKNAGEKSNSNQVSPVGARGVMQFMPENLAKFGVTDPTNPAQIIDAAGRYFVETSKQYGGNVAAMIADYNGGPRQARLVLKGKQPKAEETRKYLARVQEYMGRPTVPPGVRLPDVVLDSAEAPRIIQLETELLDWQRQYRDTGNPDIWENEIMPRMQESDRLRAQVEGIPYPVADGWQSDGGIMVRLPEADTPVVRLADDDTAPRSVQDAMPTQPPENMPAAAPAKAQEQPVQIADPAERRIRDYHAELTRQVQENPHTASAYQDLLDDITQQLDEVDNMAATTAREADAIRQAALCMIAGGGF